MSADDSVFAALLGKDFAGLAAPVRALHALDGRPCWRGQCVVSRGTHPLARLCAWAARLPPAGKGVPTTVQFQRQRGQEIWTRHFGTAQMRSRMWPHRGCLRERLGLVQFDFALSASAGDILWHTKRVRVFGLLPLPARWFARVQCREGHDARGRYTFDVQASLPWIGLIVRYQGWLLPDSGTDPGPGLNPPL